MRMKSIALCFRSLLVAGAAIATVVGCSTAPAGKAGLGKAKLDESASCKDVAQCLKDNPDFQELCANYSSTTESSEALYTCLLEGGGVSCASKCVDPKPVADESCRVGAACLLDPARGLNDLSCVALVAAQWVPSLIKCLQGGGGSACADKCTGTPPAAEEATQCPAILTCLDNFDPFNPNSDVLCAKQAPVEWQKTVSDCLVGGGGKTCASRCVGTPPSIEIPVPKPKDPANQSACMSVLSCLQEPNRISSDPACATKAPAAWKSLMTSCLNSNGGEACVKKCVGTPPPVVIPVPPPAADTRCDAPKFDQCVSERGINYEGCAVYCPLECDKAVVLCLKGSGGKECARSSCSKSI
jgi:hypothetical protein